MKSKAKRSFFPAVFGIACLLLLVAIWQITATWIASNRVGDIAESIKILQPDPPKESDESTTTETVTAVQGESPQEPSEEEQTAQPTPTPTPDPYESISKAGFFGPPLPATPPPVLTAIMGDVCILNEQEKRVGDSTPDGSKIISISSNKVVLEKDGNKSDLVLFPGS